MVYIKKKKIIGVVCLILYKYQWKPQNAIYLFKPNNSSLVSVLEYKDGAKI